MFGDCEYTLHSQDAKLIHTRRKNHFFPRISAFSAIYLISHAYVCTQDYLLLFSVHAKKLFLIEISALKISHRMRCYWFIAARRH